MKSQGPTYMTETVSSVHKRKQSSSLLLCEYFDCDKLCSASSDLRSIGLPVGLPMSPMALMKRNS